MSDKDAFADRRKSQEEEYFRKREQELIAKMRRQKDQEESRRGLREQTGIADEDLVQSLVALGYRPATVPLLDIAPLVQVAWAEGRIADREREQVIEAARARGIAAGSEADAQLAAWLTGRPDDELFRTTLRALAVRFEALPPAEREAARRELLDACEAVATAAGGILGLGKASAKEKEAVAEIRRALGH